MGSCMRFVSALLILAMLGVAINQQWQAASGFPLAWAIGVLVVAMVAGEFRDIWGRRLHRLEGAYQYRAERLEEFTRSYQLLRLSHDRLEQTVANSGFSLREGIMRLQSGLETIDGLTQASFARLLEFVAEYAALTQACIAGLSGDRVDPGRVLATVGERFPIDESDPVVRAALESGELAAVNLVNERAIDQNTLLVALPLADSTGDVHAILLVRSMPFFAFHEDNLKLIEVLAAHGVDHLRFGTATSSTARFIAAFERVHQDHARFGLDATLLRLTAATGDTAGFARLHEKLRSSVRGIDLIYMGRNQNGDKGDKERAGDLDSAAPDRYRGRAEHGCSGRKVFLPRPQASCLPSATSIRRRSGVWSRANVSPADIGGIDRRGTCRGVALVERG